jgi:hypothetical protein
MNKKQMNRKKEKEKNKRPLFFFFSFGCIIDYRFIILASIVTLESLISSVLTFYRLGHSSPGTTDSARISHGSKRVEKILVREGIDAVAPSHLSLFLLLSFHLPLSIGIRLLDQHSAGGVSLSLPYTK